MNTNFEISRDLNRLDELAIYADDLPEGSVALVIHTVGWYFMRIVQNPSVSFNIHAIVLLGFVDPDLEEDNKVLSGEQY